MRRHRELVPAALVAATCLQLSPASTAQALAEGPATQHVEITASGAPNRRDANAAMLVVSRQELLKFGDSQMSEALARVPGISIERSAGKDAVLRLRGFGNGYTQLLVNGEPVPPGFSIDALSPSMIERVEVLKTATADVSTQAIAGTINIVLKRAAAQRARELKAYVRDQHGQASEGLGFDHADVEGPLSYGVAVNADEQRDAWPALTRTDNTTAAPTVSQGAFTTRSLESQRQRSVSAAPRASWKAGPERQLILNSLVLTRQRESRSTDTRTAMAGDAPDFAADRLATRDNARQLRLGLQGKSPLGSLARMDTRLGIDWLKRRSDAVFDGDGWNGEPLLHRTVHAEVSDRSISLSGKAMLGIGEDHSLGFGWSGQQVLRKEERIQRETSSAAYPTEDLDERYETRVTRLATFLQDEWTVSERLAAYAGVRWEGLRTRSQGNTLQATGTTSSVLSPTVQALWKIQGTKSDQLRVALSRTYKAPTARELTPRRWVVAQNTPTSPNFQGNPQLKPELAWGIDAGYEHYPGEGGFLGLNLFGRWIDDVVLSRIVEQSGTWIETPVNAGSARVAGMELEGKGRLKQLMLTSADVELRASVSANWSRVDSVPGGSNRLDRMPPLAATLGADWRFAPLAIGGHFSFEQGGLSRLSTTRTSHRSAKRQLDFYALMDIGNGASVRLGLANALAPAQGTTSRYIDDSRDDIQRTQLTTFRSVKLQLEVKL